MVEKNFIVFMKLKFQIIRAQCSLTGLVLLLNMNNEH